MSPRKTDHSLWLWYLATAFGLLEGFGTFITSFDGLLPPKVLGGIAITCGIAGLIAKAIFQSGLARAPADDPFAAWGPGPTPGTCKSPPAGWYCSLDAGHTGPCPAWPTEETREKARRGELQA